MSKGRINGKYWVAAVVCIIEGKEALSGYDIRNDLDEGISAEELREEIRQEMIKHNEVGLINELEAKLLIELLSVAGDNAEVIGGFLSLLPYEQTSILKEEVRRNNILENFRVKDLGSFIQKREHNSKELVDWVLYRLMKEIEMKGEVSDEKVSSL